MATMTRDQVLKTVREAQAAGRRADLSDASLYGADLTRAWLTGAALTGADLTNADLTNAVLSDADLTDADLTNANLTGALLGGAHFTIEQLLDTRGLQPGDHGLSRDTWDELLPTSPGQRQLAEHLLRDGWNGTLREAVATVEGLAGR